MKKLLRPLGTVLTVAALAGLATAGYFTRDRWLPWLPIDRTAATGEEPSDEEASAPTGKVLLSDEAIENLGLEAKPVQGRTYWKTIQVPGMVVDRPGRSDRGVVSPVAGVVARIDHFPGDTVRPGDVLFTVRLLSESLHATQSDLFKTTQNIQLARDKRQRYESASDSIPEARIIEVDSEITRLDSAVKAYRQELLTRGLSPAQIDEAAKGNFAREITLAVPAEPADAPPLVTLAKASAPGTPPTFEVEELKVGLNQQVTAGQTLCLLANHQVLEVEGKAFRDETPLLEKSVREGWPVEVDFQEDPAADWAPLDRTFRIHHLANTIDPVLRTFAFRMTLDNQARVVETDGKTQMLWRFRPGQKVRILVRVEKLENVFVLPPGAVTRDGAEAFVFTQNVNTFERKPVRVLAQDRRHTVIAKDDSLPAGSYVVRNVAAQLNRMAKARTDSGVPKGYHIHADGSLHKNEDEGK